MIRTVSTLATLTIFTLTFASAAHAYVGPGAGLSAIGSLVALVLGALLAIVGFVWYPLKRMIKGKQDFAEDDAGEAEIAQKESQE